MIFAADERGRVTAVDAESGDRLWQQDLETGVSSGLTAVANQVYLGTRNGEVLALSQSDGEVLWRSRVSSEVLAPPSPISSCWWCRAWTGPSPPSTAAPARSAGCTPAASRR